MTRTELIEKIVHAETCPYRKTDLIDRIATHRVLSQGQSRFLATLIGDDVIAVTVDNLSDTYVQLTYDGTGKSLQSLGPELTPRLLNNAQWNQSIRCDCVTGYQD
jgi:hypothetical protein